MVDRADQSPAASTSEARARAARHVHRWRVQSGGSAITNSEAGMMFKVCPCGAVEQIGYAEAHQLIEAHRG